LDAQRRSLALVLVSLPPVAAVATGVGALLLEGGSGLGGILGPLYFILTAITGVMALGLLWWEKRLQSETHYWKREAEGHRALLRGRDRELKRLRGEVEILTAVREIGVIVNADDEFEVVITKVLDVVGDALKADDLVLFLVDTSSKALEPVARRRGRKCAFKRGLDKATISRTNVAEALMFGRLLEAEEWNAYSFALPLIVDREAVGVLKGFIPPPPPGASPRLEEIRDFLKGVERHIALAIKAPSLYSKAVLDGLTGLYTRRHLDNQIEGYFSMAVRRKTPLSILLADIDHFKTINDTHGHPSGDRILKGVAKAVMREIRKYDSAFRYGGEEICVLLPESDLDEALRIAERIRDRIETTTYRGDKRQAIPVTISIGVSTCRPWMAEPGDLVAASDAALYRAKEGGRNRVEVGDAPAPPSKKSKPRRSRKRRKTGGGTRKKTGRKTQGRSKSKQKSTKKTRSTTGRKRG